MNTDNNNLNIENLAELAKINLSTEELEKYKDQIKNIIDHFSSLKNIETEGFSLNYWEIDDNKVVELEDLRTDEIIEAGHSEVSATLFHSNLAKS